MSYQSIRRSDEDDSELRSIDLAVERSLFDPQMEVDLTNAGDEAYIIRTMLTFTKTKSAVKNYDTLITHASKAAFVTHTFCDVDCRDPWPNRSHEHPSNSTEHKPQDRRVSRLANHLWVISAISILLLVVAVSVLFILWFGTTVTFRTRLVLSDWSARIVVLSALAIRTAISLQAGIVTAMLASLIVEGQGTVLGSVPQISMMRHDNGGPHMLLQVYWAGPKQLWLTFGLLCLVFTTFTAQFTSTLLLTDLTTTGVLTSSALDLKYGFRDFNITLGQGRADDKLYDQMVFQYIAQRAEDYWLQAPTEFPAFAEYHVAPDSAPEVDDTGSTLRAMIPIPSAQDRTSILNYSGPAFVYDARVVCVAPSFDSLERCGEYSERICGKLSIDSKVSNLVTNSGKMFFNCTMSTVGRCEPPNPLSSAGKVCSDSAWTLCGLNASTGGLISILDPINNDSLTHRWYEEPSDPTFKGNFIASNSTFEWNVNVGNSYLMMNLTTDLEAYGANERSNVTTRRGYWTDVYAPEVAGRKPFGWFPYNFRATLCFDATPYEAAYWHPHDWNITATRKRTTPEPTAAWHVDTGTFDTADLRRQLGTTTSSFSDRGVLQLHSEEILASVAAMRSQWTPIENFTLALYQWHLFNLQSGRGLFRGETYSWIFRKVRALPELMDLVYCLYCGVRNTNIMQASVFNDILSETDSPALALQAQLTMMYRMAYYSWLPLFDASSPARVIQTVPRLAPTQYRGFWAVMCVIVIHILVCIVTTIFFFEQTRWSLLGNAWPAFAQAASTNEAGPLIRDGTFTSDKALIQQYPHMKRGQCYRIESTDSGIIFCLSAVELEHKGPNPVRRFGKNQESSSVENS